MAASGGNNRSPKHLPAIIKAHQNNELENAEDMRANLEKLKALSKDDLSENAMLRSRIDQQAELICILKQRADESLKKSLKLEKDIEEYRKTREEALTALQTETRKYNVLQKRFNVLNSNHEEIIAIKDDYKAQNEKLRRENERLGHENKLLFAETVKKRDEEIKTLQEEIHRLREQYSSADDGRRKMMEDMEKLTEKANKEKNELEEKIAKLEKTSTLEINTLKEKNTSFKKVVQSELDKMSELQKDRDEFAQLALERGKAIKEKTQENIHLLSRLDEAEKTLKEMSDKFTTELETMSTNSQVRRLKKQLEEAEKKSVDQQKEFEAYKKHMSTLLNREKKLNDKLRVLIG